jgi:hypothetical protein
MSLTVVWIVCIVSSIVIIVSSSLTNNAVERLISKFEIHPKLSSTNVNVTINGKRLEREDKEKVISDLNESFFLKKHNILRGTEELFLHPKNSETPFVIDTKIGKKDIRIFVYCYNDRVEVVKQYKKKLIAYSLRSDKLQKRSYFLTGYLNLKSL